MVVLLVHVGLYNTTKTPDLVGFGISFYRERPKKCWDLMLALLMAFGIFEVEVRTDSRVSVFVA